MPPWQLARPLGWTRLYTRVCQTRLDRQLGVSPSKPSAVDEDADVRADDGDVAREAGDGAEEVAEQDHDAVQLDEEPDQRPAQQDQQEPGEEGGGPLCLLPAREEEERLLGSDYDREADEE